MSGGHWSYQNDNLAREIFGWGMSPDYGERGFSKAEMARKLNPLEDKMMSELLWDVFCVLHSYDWYACSDNGEERYREDLEYFKSKWLKLGDRQLAKTEIEKCLSEARNEIYRTLGIASKSGEGVDQNEHK